MARMTQSDIRRQQEEQRAALEAPLTPEQETAVVALLGGATDSEAAEAAGVCRQTVNGWKRDPRFIARLNAERAALWEARVDRLRDLTGKAIDTLAEALDSENERVAVTAAVQVLRGCGLFADHTPKGDTSPADVQASWQSADLIKSLGRWG